MNIVVCLKRVPMTQEVDLQVAPGGREVRKESLAWVVNDWDNYAIEEAVRLQERHGGTVTAVTVGPEDDEEVLRRALAMGADQAVRVDPGDLELDSYGVARLLSEVIRGRDCDLVLTGVQADDDNCGLVGVMLAELLGLSHAAVATAIEAQNGELELRLELEGGMDERCRIRLPALLTIQTGINEPRYVSIMGIRKAGRKPLEKIMAAELGLPAEELTPRTSVEEMFLPPETGGAEMLEGDPAVVAERILRILTEKGVNV